MNGLQPWLQPWGEYLLQLASTRAAVRVTSVYRSYSDQLNLWLTRSTNPYPVAPPGQSYHQYGRAFDVNAPPWLLEEMGRVWRSWGGTWSPSDPIHFQA